MRGRKKKLFVVFRRVLPVARMVYRHLSFVPGRQVYRHLLSVTVLRERRKRRRNENRIQVTWPPARDDICIAMCRRIAAIDD